MKRNCHYAIFNSITQFIPIKTKPRETFQKPGIGIFLFIVLLLSNTTAFAQANISGLVTDVDNNPLLGVTVVQKGTTNGAITDESGKYVLSGVPEDATLVFSFLGKLDEEVPVNGQTTINVTMVEDLFKLDELVVIGYGSQSKRFTTGSISRVDMEEKKTLTPLTNVSQAVGEIAGVQFLNNGRPGQGGKLLLRGQNSLGTNTDPLIVIDGIIFEGNLSDINPQDIKTIDVLKDAASTAIYGAKAANGVIMITSNKGTSSKPQVRLNATYGISEAARWLNMPSEEQYLQRKRDYYTQQLEIYGNDYKIDIDDVSQLLKPEEYENYLLGKYSDIEDIVGQQGKLSTVDLSVSGRSENTNYLFSASMNEDVGLIKGDQETKYSFRLNLESDITDWLTIGTATFFTYRDLSGREADLSDAYDDSPYGNFYYPDGAVKFNPITSEASVYNSLYYHELTDNAESKKNLFSNMYVDIDIPFINGLSYKLNYSPNYEWQNNYSFIKQDPYSAGNTTYAQKNNVNINRWVWENILKYKKTFADVHDIDVTLMYGRNSYDREQTNVEADLFEIDILGYNQFDLGNNYIINTNAEDKFGVSSLARLNYTLLKKYMVSVAARRDGSSVFGTENKFGLFPSWAASWIVSEEAFLQNVNLVNFLKVRVSYGENGNSDISPYKTQSLNNTIYSVIGDNSGSPIAFVPDYSVMGNENMRWESTKSLNGGLDFGLLQNRISGSIDLYKKTTTDQLVRRDIPPTNAYESTYDNIGEVSNKGFELSLNTENVRNSKFNWNTSFSFSYNKNEIVHLFGDIDGDGIEDDAPDNGWFIGENINGYYDYDFDGIHQDTTTFGGVRFYPGEIKLKDISSNDTIDDDDKSIIGHGKYPDYTFTLNNTFTYGNFTLFISMNSMLGWVAPFNLVYAHGVDRPMNSLDVDYWTADNQSDTYPSLVYFNKGYENNYYVSRNFVRIKNVALSYDLNKTNLPVLSNFSSLRITLSVRNLYTFTKWLGPDPENADDVTSNKGSDDLYPMPRTYSVGINMTF